MDVVWIQDFLELAEVRNFTRAAESRNSSQAAFSRRIKALEEWLGVTLVDRSVFPTRLTPQGENFREHAVRIIAQISEARTTLTGQVAAGRDQIRIALPHALATGRFPQWSAEWSRACSLQYSIIAGNVHDTITAFVSGTIDIFICFFNAQQPIQLSSEQYERVTIESELLRPYASKEFLKRLKVAWPGSPSEPIAMLTYSQGAYLARMVDLIHENAPARFYGSRVAESDMADVLRELAMKHLGIAWLPACALRDTDRLVTLGGDRWSLPLSIVVYRDKSNKRASTQRLWEHLLKARAPGK